MVLNVRPADSAQEYRIVGPQLIDPVIRHHLTVIVVVGGAPWHLIKGPIDAEF